MLPGSQNGGLGLVGVVHRLDQDEIGLSFSGLHDLGEQRDRVLKIQIAQGLQKLAAGSDVQSDPVRRSGFRLRNGFFRVLQGGGDDFLHTAGKTQPVDAEGVGFQDVAAGVEIGLVQRGDPLRIQKVPFLRPLARLQAHGLQHRAGPAVKI